MKTFSIFTDGAARGNPGPAGAGWALCDCEGKIVSEGYRYLGKLTNNQAEYQALLLALAEAQSKGIKQVAVFADSELMVKQLKGEYKVKNHGLQPLYQKVLLTLARFETYTLKHIPREQNGDADRLANRAIDEQTG